LLPPFEMFSAAFTCSAGLLSRRWMSRSLPVPVSALSVRTWNSPTDGPHLAFSSATSPIAPGLRGRLGLRDRGHQPGLVGTEPPCSSSV
jgi:hypothetical protein